MGSELLLKKIKQNLSKKLFVKAYLPLPERCKTSLQIPFSVMFASSMKSQFGVRLLLKLEMLKSLIRSLGGLFKLLTQITA